MPVASLSFRRLEMIGPLPDLNMSWIMMKECEVEERGGLEERGRGEKEDRWSKVIGDRERARETEE